MTQVGKMLAFAVVLSLAAMAPAASFSVNFSENSGNQGFAGGENIGPLSTNSTNWNTTNGQPSLVSGTMDLLTEDDGTAFGVPPSMTWSCSNTYWNNDGTANDQRKLSVGYLDDGGAGILITVTNIPYSNYRVYGLVATDQNAAGEYDVRNFYVNSELIFGGDESTTALGYGSVNASETGTTLSWSPMDAAGTTRGNYWAYETAGSTLTIDGLARNGVERGTLTGFVVEEVPEPATMSLLALGGMAMLKRRKK